MRRSALLGLLLLAGCGGAPAARPDPTGSTLRSTWVDPVGAGVLRPGPGEPLRPRTELAPASRPVRTLATFAQITDAHVRDEESPARLPFLDRFGKPFESAFRPQEALSAQVLAGAVRAVDTLRPQAVIEGGDLVDDDQANELDLALGVLRGGRVNPDSGAPGYEGVQASDDPDPFYYRPALDPPRQPGLLDRAQRPFTSPGLHAPWFPVAGNHDLLVQGELAPTPATNRVATGDRALWEPPRGLPVPRDEADLPRAVARALAGGHLPAPGAGVPPDPRRRELPAEEVLARLRTASGHGGRGPLLDYAFDIGPALRGIVLDVVRRDAGSGGVVRPLQLAWLRAQLARAGTRRVVVFSHQPLASSTGGAAALDLLAADRRVLAAISGHTHRNAIALWRRRLWLVTTGSLADHPQQARAFRLSATADGGVVLDTWMLDHLGPRVARDLAFTDAQGGRPEGLAGGPGDRNARLYAR